MLSPNFKVREFQVKDINVWPVAIQYHNDSKQVGTEEVIVAKNFPVPCTAKVTFNKKETFPFHLV